MLTRNLTLMATLVAPLAAQVPLDFAIDQAASQYTWSGNTSVGPLLGNPSNSFELFGNFMLELDAGPANAEFQSGGVAHVTPDISARIPNPVPGFPDLAVVDITGMSFEYTTPSFTVTGGGNFSTMVVVTILSGTLTVTPLIGSPSVTDLSGISGDPQAMNGTITSNGAGVNMDSPQSSTFDFTDSGSGISASITLTGTIRGDSDCQTSVNYCSANANSTGLPAAIFHSGSTSLSSNSMSLAATNMPNNQFGYFLASKTSGFIANPGGSQGNLCLGGTVARFVSQLQSTGSTGSYSIPVDLTNIPTSPPTSVQVGETWHCSTWFRDKNPGPTSNFSNGVSITFCP